MKRGSVVMLLEVLIAAAIVLWLAQFMLKQYAKTSPSAGAGASSPQSAVQATRQALDQAQKTEAQRLKELEEANR